MFVQFMPAGLLGHAFRFVKTQTEASIPVCHRPFPFWGSTGSKQTLNGLFYVSQPELFFSDKSELRDSNILNF